MMRNYVALLATIGFVSALAPQAFAQAGNEVVATVGDNKITVKDFNQRYEEVQKATVNPPPKEVFLEDLVRYELGVQEAYKKGVEKDPIVKERMRQEVYKGLLEKELGKKTADIKVNEKEMQAYYAKNPEIRTSHILIEFKPDATAEQKAAAKKRAEEILSDVQKSKRPFEELVGLYSDDVLSKKTGGDVGWQSSMTLVPSYYQAILKMKTGEVKGLIETQYGYHIVKLTGRRPYADANKRQIRAAVFDEKRKDIFDAYFNGLKSKYKISVNKNALK